MGDVVEAPGDIRIQHVFRLEDNGVKDRFVGILGATAWARIRNYWVQNGLPIPVPGPA